MLKKIWNADKIVNQLNQHKSEIIKILLAKNWRHFKYYFSIRDKFLSGNLDKQFRKDFCNFYIMNGARGLNNLQKDEFFELLSSGELVLDKILKVLHATPGFSNSHKLFLSFATKLLHTRDKTFPIYDGNIAFVLELPKQLHLPSLEEKVKNRIDIYNDLKNKFSKLLASVKVNSYLKDIRSELHNKASFDQFEWRDDLISDTKLLDSLLWALYSVLKKMKDATRILHGGYKC